MKYLIHIFCILCFSPTFAQNVKNKYNSHTTEAGTIYYIHPQKGFECKEIPSKLEFDVTYISTKDSVTYNFTFFNSTPSPVDSISMNSEGEKLTLPASMLFIEPSKNKWKHRVSIKVPSLYYQNLNKRPKPYSLKLYSTKDEYAFYLNDNDWKKQTAIINKIFDIIKYNQY